MKEKIITSFGSGFIRTEDSYYSEIVAIGKLLAECGYTVCSGGYAGSMEAISRGAKSGDGKTIGVTVTKWNSPPNEFVDEEVKMPNLMERICELITLAEGYIVFRGGTGTLMEISVALELMNKKAMPEKPVVFYGDFWQDMIEILKQDSSELKAMIERNVRFIKKATDIPGQLEGISN